MRKKSVNPDSEKTNANKVEMLCSAGQDIVANFLLQLDLTIAKCVVY